MTLRQLLRSSGLFLALIAGGFVAIVLGWTASTRTTDPTIQVPQVLSGGVGGLGLVVLGAALLYVHIGRVLAAQAIVDGETALDLIAEYGEGVDK